jgi:hypothetical protein
LIEFSQTLMNPCDIPLVALPPESRRVRRLCLGAATFGMSQGKPGI